MDHFHVQDHGHTRGVARCYRDAKSGVWGFANGAWQYIAEGVFIHLWEVFEVEAIWEMARLKVF